MVKFKNLIVICMLSFGLWCNVTQPTVEVHDTDYMESMVEKKLEVIFQNGLTGKELASDEITISRYTEGLLHILETKFAGAERIKLQDLIYVHTQTFIPPLVLREMHKVLRKHRHLAYVIPQISEERVVFCLMINTPPHKIFYGIALPNLGTLISEFAISSERFYSENPGIEVLDGKTVAFGAELSTSGLKVEIFFGTTIPHNFLELFEDLKEGELSTEMLDQSLRDASTLGSYIKEIFFKIEDDLDNTVRQIEIRSEYNKLNGEAVQYYLEALDKMLSSGEEGLCRLLFEDGEGGRPHPFDATNRMRLSLVDFFQELSFSPVRTGGSRPIYTCGTYSIYGTKEAVQELDSLPNGLVSEPTRFMPHLAMPENKQEKRLIRLALYKMSQDVFQIYLEHVPEHFEFHWYDIDPENVRIKLIGTGAPELYIYINHKKEGKELFSSTGLLKQFINTLDPKQVDPNDILRYLLSVEELYTNVDKISTFVAGTPNLASLGTDHFVRTVYRGSIKGPKWEDISKMRKQFLTKDATLQTILRDTPIYTINVIR